MHCKTTTLLTVCLTLLSAAASQAQEVGEHRTMPRRPVTTTNPDVHDPVMAKGEDGQYHIFATGMGISTLSSPDMKTWRIEPSVLNPIPQWAADTVRGYHGHTWAPDISYHNGQWLLYYSCSTFGKNGSAIGLATNKTLDASSPSFKWEDQGCVITSHQRKDHYNAIDPNLIIDKKGTSWLAFGSFWDGIQLVKLKKDFKTLASKPVTISRRTGRKITLAELNDVENYTIEGGDTIEAGSNAVEAPFIIRHGKYYYLFVSFDYCCRGERSTYRTVVGRSKKVTGPYLDSKGQPMTKGGGDNIIGPNADFFGAGHCSAYCFDGQWFFICHAYTKAENGRAKLFMRKMAFSKDGWPVLE